MDFSVGQFGMDETGDSREINGLSVGAEKLGCWD